MTVISDGMTLISDGMRTLTTTVSFVDNKTYQVQTIGNGGKIVGEGAIKGVGSWLNNVNTHLTLKDILSAADSRYWHLFVV